MIHLALPYLLVGVLFGCGLYATISRRNAVLMLVGVELILAAAGLLLVTTSIVLRQSAGQVVTLFLITIAAAEIAVALALVSAVFRSRGTVDLDTRAQEDPS